MLRQIRRLWRLSLLLALLGGGLLVQLLVQPWLGVAGRRAFIGSWSRLLLACCGVRLLECPPAESAAVGAVPSAPPALALLAEGRMLVANHPSWLDIFAINALAPAAFVAKSEIRDWPLLGRLVGQAGTVFIERGRRRAVPEAIVQMRERLQQGYPVAFFPEALTHAGPTLGVFHSNLLEAAIAESAEIVPLGLDYRHPDGTVAVEAHFIGDTTFAQSVWAILGCSCLVVSVHVLSPVPPAGRQRRELAAVLRAQIGQRLGLADSAAAGG